MPDYPLQSLIARFLDAERRGEVIDRDALISQHPDHADSLLEFFANHDSMKMTAGTDQSTLHPAASGLIGEAIPRQALGDESMLLPSKAGSETEQLTLAWQKTTVGDSRCYFGDYELLGEIARGGMGVVYKALQTNLNRIVALKMILTGQLAGEEDVKRFYTEAEAAANLDHPGIVPIFEVGQHQGQHYFSMGYIEGQSLAQKVAGSPLPQREAAELVRKICEAMAYAHERGVIHRDLKPANILLDQTGQPKVTDFGLAKKMNVDSGLTGTGQILGTPSYMAPEQASGKINVGPMADVYALGAILYCLLTGRPPFQAANPMDTLLQVLDKEPIPLRQVNSAVPIDLETICLKCLAKVASRRYGSAADICKELDRFLRGEPIHARRVTATERAWLWCRRQPTLAALSASFVIALLVGAGVSVLFAARADREAKQATAAKLDAMNTLYNMNVAFGMAADRDIRPAEALLWFSEAAKLAKPGSSQEHDCRVRHLSWSQLSPSLKYFFEHEKVPLKSMEYDASGTFLVALTVEGVSTVWQATAEANPLRLCSNGVAQAWHPTRAELAIALDNQTVLIVSLNSQTSQEIHFSEPVTALAFDHHGRKLAISGTTLRLWNLESSEFDDSSNVHPGVVLSIKFSDDDSTILTLCDDDRVRLFRAGTADSLIQPILHRGKGFPDRPIVEPIFVNSGRGVLVKSGATVTWIDASTGQPVHTMVSASPNATSMASSPDGRSFVITWQGTGYQVWDALNVKMIAESIDPQGSYWMAAYSPDGLDIANLKQDTFERFKSVDGELYGPISPLIENLRHLRWSPDGRRIAVADAEGRVFIWQIGAYLPTSANLPRSRNPSVSSGHLLSQSLGGKNTRLKQSQSEKFVLASGSNLIFGNLRRTTVFSASDGAMVASFENTALLIDACISDDDQLIATATLDNEIALWHWQKPQWRRTLAKLESEPLRIEFGPTSETLILLQVDGTVRALNTDSGDTLWCVSHAGAETPDFLRDTSQHMYRRQNRTPQMQFEKYDLLRGEAGAWFATTCYNDIVCVWNAEDGTQRIPQLQLEKGPVTKICRSNDGHSLAVAGNGRAVVFDLSTGRHSANLDFVGVATGMTFDSQGKRLALFSEINEGFVWDWESGERLLPTLHGTSGVFVGEQDEWLLAATDYRCRLFSTSTGEPVTPSWPLDITNNHSFAKSTDGTTVFITGTGLIADAGTLGRAGTVLEILHLSDFLEFGPLTSSDQQLRSEFLSGREIVNGRVEQLSQEESLQRMHSIRKRFPELMLSDWHDSYVIGWHRNQLERAKNDGNVFAAEWHAEKLARLPSIPSAGNDNGGIEQGSSKKRG